jgi:hypothetical protein
MLGGRVGTWWHQCGGRVGTLDAENGGADLNLVAGRELRLARDPLAVDVGAVGGAEILDPDRSSVREETGVLARDAGVVDHQVGGALLAAERQLAVDGVLAAGPCSFVDHQRRHRLRARSGMAVCRPFRWVP